MRVVATSGGPTRNDSVSVGDRVLRRGRRGHDPARAAVGGRLAQGEAEVVDPAGQLAGDAPGRPGVGRQADAERQPGRRRPDGVDARRAGSGRARPTRPPPVQRRREELRGQVVVRGRDLDAVEAALGRRARRRARSPRRSPRSPRRWRHAARRGSGGSGSPTARDGRRARRARDLLPAAVEELHEEPRAVRPDGLHDAAVAADDRRRGSRRGYAGSAGPTGQPRSPRARSARRRPARGPRGRRRSRPSAGGRGRGSSGEPSRRSGFAARPVRARAG